MGVTYPAAGVMVPSPATAPVTMPERTRFPIDPADCHPGKCPGSGSGIGDHNCIDCHAVCRKGTAAIEPEPAEPEEPGTEQGHGDIVRLHGILAVTCTFPDDEGNGKCSKPGTDVDDNSPGKINAADCGKPSPAPDPVGRSDHRPALSREGRR